MSDVFRQTEKNISAVDKDAWSPAFVAVYALVTILIVMAPNGNGELTLLLMIFIILGLIVAFVWFWCYLFRWRPRHALSIIIAFAVASSIGYYAPRFILVKDKIAFHSRRAEFEQQVEEARVKQHTQGPLQIVVYYEDQSVFVTANSFFYIVYDETDGASPYMKSSDGTITVAAPNNMQHLTGHFYCFRVSY